MYLCNVYAQYIYTYLCVFVRLFVHMYVQHVHLFVRLSVCLQLSGHVQMQTMAAARSVWMLGEVGITATVYQAISSHRTMPRVQVGELYGNFLYLMGIVSVGTTEPLI